MLAREVKSAYHGSAASLRISIDGEGRDGDSSANLVVINGGEVVIYAGNAGVGKGKVQGPGDNAGAWAGAPRSHLAAELDARSALT